MVNEFSYCPRLFFLEWVDARWADNADSEAGAFVHRRVDRPRGNPSPPEAIDGVSNSRSLTLSSERLGLIATLDVVEFVGPEATPVDYKRGAVPDVPGRSWDSDRVQVCVQGLLLRENGFTCSRGILYYAESRERVEIDLDEQLVEHTMRLLVELRAVALSDVPPPPLIASPKCPRCSLVGICLPDEINHLDERSVEPPRRLTPRADAARPLYLTTQGTTLGVSSGRIEVRSKQELVDSARLIDVSQVCVYGNVQVTTQALRELMRREIPVLFFSYGGWFSGIAEGLPAKNVNLRRRQVAVAANGGLEVARRMVSGKIRNSRTFLRRNARADVARAVGALRSLVNDAEEAVSVASLLGIEGAAARLYFQSFAAMLRADLGFDFEGRNRRPPRDPVNCLLSFSYGLLVKDLTAVVRGIGFDPYLGVYHRPRFGRPALALDLAEEFRPIISDSVVVNMINNGEVRRGDFISRAGGFALTNEGRRAAIVAYERRLDHEIKHPQFGYRATYRRVLEVQARVLAAHVVGEIASYKPFTTR